MDAYEFAKGAALHYPHLFQYVVLIAHENEDTGAESIGSGVLVGLDGRHLVATAAHCMKRNPRVIRDEGVYEDVNKRLVTRPPVSIMRRWLHSSLDIGFLEIDEALGSEVGENQLYFDRVGDGHFHFVGYPNCRWEENHPPVKSVFATTVIGQTDTYLKFDYPTHGFQVEGNDWVRVPFIATPHGFSGCGCFGVSSDSGDVQVVGYKLLGIQSTWHPTERWVKVVSIRHWLDGVKSQLG